MKLNTVKTVKLIENEVYSRVVGYYRPIKNWNEGKQKEFSERKLISVNEFKNSAPNCARDFTSDLYKAVG
jgi:Anaerobic ribonucleoside-triphosphate reductase